MSGRVAVLETRFTPVATVPVPHDDRPEREPAGGGVLLRELDRQPKPMLVVGP